MNQQSNVFNNIVKPFAQNQVGEEPLYHEYFEQIKTELEHLNTPNYALINELCYKLLTQTCKDLRVLGFYCLAQAHEGHLKGLGNALQIYAYIIAHFKDVYPQSQRGRMAALKWLNNGRILAVIKNNKANSLSDLNTFKETLTEFNRHVTTYLDENMPTFNSLDNYLIEVDYQMPMQEIQAPMTACNQTKPIVTPQKNNALETLDEVHHLQRQIIDYHINERQWHAACRLSRSHRFSYLDIPTHHKNISVLEPPRREAILSLEKKLSLNHHEDIVESCERLFLERSNHFYLDLQCYVYHALQKMNEKSLALFIQNETQDIVHRFPKLLQLRFKNNLSFASEPTKLWLSTTKPVEKPHPKKNESNQLHDLQQFHSYANIKDAFHKIQSYDPKNNYESIICLFAKAQACHHFHQTDTSFILYHSLYQRIIDSEFELWHPLMAKKIWQTMAIFLNELNLETAYLNKMNELRFYVKKALLNLNSNEAHIFLIENIKY